jgi:hypothetical protein
LPQKLVSAAANHRMSELELILGSQRLHVSTRSLMTCGLFQNDPTLLSRPYTVRCRPSPSAFQLFLAAVEGRDFKLTHDIASDVLDLCTEFGFPSLAQRVHHFLHFSSPECLAAAIDRIAVLEKRMAHSQSIHRTVERQQARIDELEKSLEVMKQQFSRLFAQVETLPDYLLSSVESAVSRSESAYDDKLK